MTSLEILVGARKLIDSQEKWVGCGKGLRTPAGRYCAQTAITKAARERDASDIEPINCLLYAAGLRRFTAENAIYILWDFNDTHTHAEVLAAFDSAIKAERAKESVS